METLIACTLTPANLATQGERWRRLGARALIQRVPTEHGLRIVFRAEPGVEDELQALVAIERECCAWADWTVEVGLDQVVLAVCSTGEGISTLHGMFARLA
jgi:hypothetical protein